MWHQKPIRTNSLQNVPQNHGRSTTPEILHVLFSSILTRTQMLIPKLTPNLTHTQTLFQTQS